MILAYNRKRVQSTTPVLGYWDISTASWVSEYSVAGLGTYPTEVRFGDNGYKMYVSEFDSSIITQYNLSTAYDQTTATLFGSKSVFINFGFNLKTDGTKLYAITYATSKIYEYNFGTAWDITTLSYVYQANLTQDGFMTSCAFNADGTKLYTTGFGNNKIYQYSLSTAWNTSTLSFVQDFAVGTNCPTPMCIHLKPDGTQAFLVSNGTGNVVAYNFGTAYDASSLSYDKTKSVAAKENQLDGVTFNDTGSSMYVIGYTSRKVHKYNL